jgi:hypothetical protein
MYHPGFRALGVDPITIGSALLFYEAPFVKSHIPSLQNIAFFTGIAERL